MKLKLVETEETQRVSLHDILDYGLFSRQYRNLADANELRVFEKFHAARLLLREGLDAYLNVTIAGDDEASTIQADACGVNGDRIIAVFCPISEPNESTWRSVRTINRSQNARALILSPQPLDTATIQRQVPGGLESGKVKLEILGWFDDTLEETFQQTLRIIELLVNETRMRMLAPLFHKSAVKKEYRAKINPKLVYHNLTALSEAGLVDEPLEGTYELSQFGKTVLAEFITFLEKTRRTLHTYKPEEVKSNGR